MQFDKLFFLTYPFLLNIISFLVHMVELEGELDDSTTNVIGL
jgi:hypothetical protein